MRTAGAVEPECVPPHALAGIFAAPADLIERHRVVLGEVHQLGDVVTIGTAGTLPGITSLSVSARVTVVVRVRAGPLDVHVVVRRDRQAEGTDREREEQREEKGEMGHEEGVADRSTCSKLAKREN